MSPNLDAGVASGSTQFPAEQEVTRLLHEQHYSHGLKPREKMGQLCEHTHNVHKVQSAVHELAEHLQAVQMRVAEGVACQNALSTRIDGMTERIQAARGRLVGLRGHRCPSFASQWENF